MRNTIELMASQKNGITSPESYIIVRDNISYLRIIGKYPSWHIMTATASEDHGVIRVCANQHKLISAASSLRGRYGALPVIMKDWANRDYAVIGTLTKNQNENFDSVNEYLNQAITLFFEIFDSI